jgi:histidinol dehydrogenase
MQDAWDSTSEDLKAAMRLAQANIAPSLRSSFRVRGVSSHRGHGGGPDRAAARIGRLLRARRPLSASLHAADDRHAAQVAGVERIVVCSPKPAPETLAAAYLAGVTEFYRIGGAQAIAALAYGTAPSRRSTRSSAPAISTSPPQRWLVSHHTGHRHARRPDRDRRHQRDRRPTGIAADLVAQAEHDPEALAILITSKPELALEVARRSKAPVAGQ